MPRERDRQRLQAWLQQRKGVRWYFELGARVAALDPDPRARTGALRPLAAEVGMHVSQLQRARQFYLLYRRDNPDEADRALTDLEGLGWSKVMVLLGVLDTAKRQELQQKAGGWTVSRLEREVAKCKRRRAAPRPFDRVLALRRLARATDHWMKVARAFQAEMGDAEGPLGGPLRKALPRLEEVLALTRQQRKAAEAGYRRAKKP